jgi:hypothetical protein
MLGFGRGFELCLANRVLIFHQEIRPADLMGYRTKEGVSQGQASDQAAIGSLQAAIEPSYAIDVVER